MEDQIQLPTLYQQQIHATKYARWNDELGRRETWTETVDRYMTFVQKHLIDNHAPLSEEVYNEIRSSILSQDVLPSMRALMVAGPALERDHIAAYNCSYIAVDRIKAFSEALFILCCGTGVGFSVESRLVRKLPEVPDEFHPTDTTIVVADSKQGWATAFDELLRLLYGGKVPKVDYSRIREAGARLKTFGGRASGPAPLKDLFEYTIALFRNAAGRKLTTDECHGIMCKVGDIVVVGGVRRSALISLSDPTDDRMKNAKSGQWWENTPHFALANNSAVWEEKPSVEQFMDEWTSLIKSKSGERGIFNRKAAQAKVASLPNRDPGFEFGVNPCGEIILRDREFCNLSQVTVRPGDDFEELARKVKLATILGTIQATFTKFRYISKQWQKNCEEEALLGVGFTGIMSHAVMAGSGYEGQLENWLATLRDSARKTNANYASQFGINAAAAITCVKPAGNSTELVSVEPIGNGMHEVYDRFYVRRNRGNKNDPVANLLYMQGVPTEDEILHPDTTWVFSYPMKAPQGAVTRNDRTAIERLEHWLAYAEHWCDHNPSVTVNVREEEWIEVGAWVYKHFDKMIGVTFLPYSEHTYQQAPYETITEEQYNALVAEMPKEIDWSLLSVFETEDQTEGVQELACMGGSCEIA